MQINLSHEEVETLVTDKVRSLGITNPLEITFVRRNNGVLDTSVNVLSEAEAQAKQQAESSVAQTLGLPITNEFEGEENE